ncbi:hypothetical protein V6Z11_D02G129200 [Gossypium hirsutum]|uniref:Formin-like protein 1 isoform X2 n=1 Tax=Gossypium hirsutum TaxID=3635 RepID=A0A1U8JXT6_GOSHI|nr:formin-like protein 1 isoform X2 [Gossypium hirsutum]
MSIPNPDSHVSDRNIGSPSLSSTATSPNRTLIEKLDASIRNFKDLVRNIWTPSISASAATSSFKLNEEMIKTLFVAKKPNPKPKQATPCSVLPSPNQDNRVLDPKKAQNIAILLRALNVTVEEVCEALLEDLM